MTRNVGGEEMSAKRRMRTVKERGVGQIEENAKVSFAFVPWNGLQHRQSLRWHYGCRRFDSRLVARHIQVTAAAIGLACDGNGLRNCGHF